jgi:hypothetical protein
MEVIKERNVRIEKSYWINFDSKADRSWGFIFPANSDGTPVLEQMSEEAKKNYFECEATQDKYYRWFEEREHTIIEPAVGKCHCGCEVELDADFAYHGAVQCEKCGQWYNLFGQKLVDPKYWEEDDPYYNN